ncbi:MAG: nucleoid-associated protein [Flavipsychrobacter sp.]
MRADFSNTQIQALATHFVGNKHTDNTFFYSEELVRVQDEELQEQLKQYFTAPFAEKEEYFEFYHESDEALNTVKHYAEKIFADQEQLLEHSISIAKHLFEISDAPNIKSGELHVAYLDKVYLNDEVMPAIGLYKTEERDAFFQLSKQHTGYEIELQKGISADKLDKGCIIFNTRKGMQLCIVDKTNKRSDAVYWRDKFLKITAMADEYHHTREYLAATKDFIVKGIPQEYEVSKAEQADYLNRSLEFFRNNKQFDEQEFANEVFQDKELISSFNGYKHQYEENHDVSLNGGFDISDSAVKRTARVFKSVIKLDKNFHVYVHGDRDLIEKGYDEAVGKHYYKIYFDKEQ